MEIHLLLLFEHMDVCNIGIRCVESGRIPIVLSTHSEIVSRGATFTRNSILTNFLAAI